MGRAKAKIVALFIENQSVGFQENDVQRLFTLARQHIEYKKEKNRFRTIMFWADWMLHNEITRHEKVLLRFAEELSRYDDLKGNVKFNFLIQDLSNEIAIFLKDALEELFKFGFNVENHCFDSILTHACHLVAETPIKQLHDFRSTVKDHDILLKEIKISHGICWSRGGNVPGFNINADAEIYYTGGEVQEVLITTEFLIDPCPCCGCRYLSCSVDKNSALAEGCGRLPIFHKIP